MQPSFIQKGRMSKVPGIDEGANPMPNQGKWITYQNAFRFFADGEKLLFWGPRDFPLFTQFFLHRASVSALRIGNGEAPGNEGWRLIFYPCGTLALQE
jgi:hypothetical protein